MFNFTVARIKQTCKSKIRLGRRYACLFAFGPGFDAFSEGAAKNVMQLSATQPYKQSEAFKGCRVSNKNLREVQRQVDEFSGLEPGTNHYELLLLVKRVGKEAGFTRSMICLLDYYFAFTRPIDWQTGKPIVYQALSKTALDLGISERQVQKLEKELAGVGAICFRDSGNFKRYGFRDAKTGAIQHAFGVDLSPLAVMKGVLEEQLAEKRSRNQAWMELKRQLTSYRSLIRGLIAELAEQGEDVAELLEKYRSIAIQIRSHLKVAQLETLAEGHRKLYRALRKMVGKIGKCLGRDTQVLPIAQETRIGSPRDEVAFVHKEDTIQKPFNKLNTGSRGDAGERSRLVQYSYSRSCGDKLFHDVSIEQLISVSSQRLKAYLPLGRSNLNDLIEAAYRLSSDLGISQPNWARACETLGRLPAALCILLTDQAMHRSVNPVRQPSAYLQGMVNRGSRGELNLIPSIQGMYARGDRKKTCSARV
jgi:replication initiation protein RepC